MSVTCKTTLVTGNPVQYEFTGDSTLSPGMAVDVKAGSAATCTPHVADNAPLMVVSELGLVTYEGTNVMAGTYDTGDQLPVLAPRSGDRVQARLEGTATGTLSMTEGDVVYTAAGGYLSSKTAGSAVGVAMTDAEATAAADHPLFTMQVR